MPKEINQNNFANNNSFSSTAYQTVTMTNNKPKKVHRQPTKKAASVSECHDASTFSLSEFLSEKKTNFNTSYILNNNNIEINNNIYNFKNLINDYTINENSQFNHNGTVNNVMSSTSSCCPTPTRKKPRTTGNRLPWNKNWYIFKFFLFRMNVYKSIKINIKGVK